MPVSTRLFDDLKLSSLEVELSADQVDFYEQQLMYLNEFVEPNLAITQRPKVQSFKELYIEKLKRRSLIRASKELVSPYRESYSRGQNLKIFGSKVTYNYQRVDQKFEDLDAVLGYFGLDKLDLDLQESQFFLVNSCQAAISLFLQNVKKIFPDQKFIAPEGGYWETMGVLKYLELPGAVDSFKSEGSVFILDSSTVGIAQDVDCDLKTKIAKSKNQIAIFDSTCWQLNDSKTKKLAQLFLNQGIPLVIFRSHLKLDCLGLEYGRLGSVCILTPKHFDERLKWSNLRKEFSASLSFFGGFSYLTESYPFFEDFRILSQSEKWCGRIEKAHSQFFALPEIQKCNLEKMDLVRFKHDKFFYLVLKRPLSDSSMQKISENLSRTLQFAQLPYLSIASYPWDFIGYTFFKTQHSFGIYNKNSQVIRFCLPTLEASQIKVFSDSFLYWAKDIEKTLSHAPALEKEKICSI